MSTAKTEPSVNQRAKSRPKLDDRMDAERVKMILARGRAVLQSESSAILAALARLDDSFIDAVQMIAACPGRICVTGVGKAGLIGAKIQATLASTGTLAYALHPV